MGMNLQIWKSNSHLRMDKMEAGMTLIEGQISVMIIDKIEAGMALTKGQNSVVSIEEEDRTYVRSIIGHSIAVQNQTSRILELM